MNPTDNDLDRAIVEARGAKWRRASSSCRYLEAVQGHPDYSFSAQWPLANGDESICADAYRFVQPYCADRNLLPDVLALVREHGRAALESFVGELFPQREDWHMAQFEYLGLPMREIVEAALRACGKWREDWTE